jgi:hypothetical protein
MAVTKYLLIGLCIFTVGCGALDDGGSDGPAQLKGLWLGDTEEQGVTEALATSLIFFEEQVFILREDEAHVGTYTVLANDSAMLNTTIYSYGTPDTDNNFYVGTRSSNRIEVDALFATEQSLFINFDGSARSGSATLTLDAGRVTDMSVTRVRGTWKTTDSILYINDEGGLQGSNSATGCQWKGKLQSLNADFLKLSIERKLCNEFNQAVDSPADGFAFIDGEGNLHFIAEQPNEFLWMQFTPDATTGGDAAAEEDDPAAEEEAAAV